MLGSRGKIAAALMIAVVITVGVIQGIRQYKHKDDLYYKTFTSSMTIINKAILTDCQLVNVSLQVTDKSAILTVNDVKMTGTILEITADDVLVVQFTDGPILGFAKQGDLLMILSSDTCTILSNSPKCEEITSFLDQIQK